MVAGIKSSDEVSEGGSPIYRHAEPSPRQAVKAEECIEQISCHIETHLGRIETVFHEIVSDAVHIDVHVVEPTSEFPFVRLVTSGMSDLPMTTPDGSDAPRFAELLVTLPGDWHLDQKSFDNESWYWPVRLLKYLARLPHDHQTWLGWGHTIPNGDPPKPYAAGTRLSGSIVLPSITVPDDFHTLSIDERKTITFYSVVPLYAEEMNLKLRSGTDALLTQLSKRRVMDIIDSSRMNVSKKWFGLF